MREIDRKDLSDYLEKTVHNLSAPLDAYPPAVLEAESLLVHIVDCLNHPEGFVASTKMFMFSHSAWRSALVLSISGANSHVTPVLRQSLEAAMYGYLFRFDAKYVKLWVERETSNTSKSKFRNSWSQRTKVLLRQSNLDLSNRIYKQLDDLIAFGGHPNFLSVETGFEVEEEQFGGDFQMSFSYLGDHDHRTVVLIQAAMVAEKVALLFAQSFPERARFMDFDNRLSSLGRKTLALIREGKAE